MNATLGQLNARYKDNVERLLAASSQIVRLENGIKAANEIIEIKQAKIEALVPSLTATIMILEASMPLFPLDLLGQVTDLITKARGVLSLVESVGQ